MEENEVKNVNEIIEQENKKFKLKVIKSILIVIGIVFLLFSIFIPLLLIIPILAGIGFLVYLWWQKISQNFSDWLDGFKKPY